VIIYLLVNQVNRKGYVGQTRQATLSKRWAPSLNNSPNSHLAAAIRKYGANNFTRTVLAHASSQREADVLERFFIGIYQTTDRRFGYNLQAGGRQGPERHIQEVKERIRRQTTLQWASRSPKDRWEFQLATKLRWLSRTEEERNKISENITKALTGKPRTTAPWNKGLKIPGQPKTDEHRRKIGLGIRRHYEKEVWMTPRKPMGRVIAMPAPTTVDRKPPKAVKGLKEIQETRRQLRAIQKRLNQLEFEFKGGCAW
jgi:group I intron endonuclease